MFYSSWYLYKEVYLKKIRQYLVKEYLKQVKDRSKPLFIHINRTAGSSISGALGITEIHYTLEEYEQLYFNQFKEKLPEDIAIWTSIRNPFAKVASQYYYRVATNQNQMRKEPISFNDWLIKAYAEKSPEYRDREIMFQQQKDWLKTTRNYNINYIRFENLISDYSKVALLYDGKPLLRKKKSMYSGYKNLYSTDNQLLIKKEFKDDITLFNYSF